MKLRNRRLLLLAAASVALPLSASAQHVSAPVIFQWFESSWKTMEKRTADHFMSGYGAIWTPPPGRALYDDQGGGIGYNLYDRFDLGKAGDTTLYGTEKGYRSLIDQVHRANGDVYVDYIHHHVGSWDVPGYNGWGGWIPAPGAQVQDRSDYPGFEISDPYVGANSFNPNYRNLAGHRDTYPDAPPVNDGNTPQYQYQYRLAHLLTIDLTSNRSFVRNPVPGNPGNIRQAAGAWAIGTSTLLPNGKPGASTVMRQANTPDANNARFYPDNSLPGITVTDPATGGGSYTIYPFNKNTPLAGDATSETNAGYMMRYAQWLVNEVGVDGLRIDAARHVPYGQTGDAYNPANLNMPALVDRATFRQSTRTNLDGTQRTVFNFQEVFSGDQNLLQTFTRKDINPNTPNVVGGNRDVLDFPMWFAMRGNFTTNGARNNWYNVRFASQDNHDDGQANNGSQSIGFVINHDDGKGNINDQANDYIALDNVAHAWILMRPGNAYVYFKANEFDRTGNSTFFLKDGRGDALGGLYGNIVTKLVDIRNTHGRGNFQERWIDPGGSSAVYVFERLGSAVVGLNIGYNAGSTSRTVNTSFPSGTRLVELTGNWQDPSGTVPQTITVDGSGQATITIPWNNGANGNKGYVIYGLPQPHGALSLGNVSQTIAGETPTAATNGTARLASIDVITGNSFTATLNTTKVTLSDGFHDSYADGDAAYLRLDGGVDLNGNGTVDFRSTATADATRYGFENFTTTNDPGYDPNPSISGNGSYSQVINTTGLSEGYHYLTARAFRHKGTVEQEVFRDFKKVIYIDRLPPTSAVSSFASTGGNSQNRDVQVRSTDLTADSVHLFLNLPAALTDAQVLAMVNAGNKGSQIDRDLFSRGFTGVASGNNVITSVTYEITGNYSVQRFPGQLVTTTLGAGLGDTNLSNTYTGSDVSGAGGFEELLYSLNTQFNPAGDLNGDGRIDNIDLYQLPGRYQSVGATSAQTEARNAVLRRGDVTGNYVSAASAADIDQSYQNLGSTLWKFDFDADGGGADQSDIDTLVHVILHSEYGDATLDGSVNSADFNLLASNFGAPSGRGWATGDFSGDTAVNSADFNLLATNFGFVYTDGAFALPGGAVPEPALAGLFALSAMGFRRRRA